jgi:hypothetical protein
MAIAWNFGKFISNSLELSKSGAATKQHCFYYDGTESHLLLPGTFGKCIRLRNRQPATGNTQLATFFPPWRAFAMRAPAFPLTRTDN